MEALNFKNLLNAHSHFAFGGWISLTLAVLLTHEILPAATSERPVYQWLFGTFLFTASGMLFSFPFLGYTFLPILFSTLFIVCTYLFTWVFIKDLIQAKATKAVAILSVSALLCLVLSSAGPFALAYVLASHSANALFYKDSIYTYLHFQYNGFFSLAVFALFIQRFGDNANQSIKRNSERFAGILALSVLPTLFLSYLWHYPNFVIRILAIVGCAFIVFCVVRFCVLLRSLQKNLNTLPFPVKLIGFLSFLAFILKSILQCGVAVPSIGEIVFANRPIIIGYLHLVLLGFISLYLLAHLSSREFLDVKSRLTRISLYLFLSAVIGNELVLMTQGICAMLLVGSSKFQWMLWYAAICLLIASGMIFVSRIKLLRVPSKKQRMLPSEQPVHGLAIPVHLQ